MSNNLIPITHMSKITYVYAKCIILFLGEIDSSIYLDLNH